MTKTLNTIPDSDFKFKGVWAMGDHLLMSPTIAIDDRATIVYEPPAHWGDENLYVTVNNPTHMDLFKAADDLIRRSGDMHHVFIESIKYNEKRDVWELWTGS